MVYQVRRKRIGDYLIPLFILISVGIIIILGFNLYSLLTKKPAPEIYMHITEGKAKMLPWGLSEWQNAFSDTKILQGDSIKTLKESKVVIKFFNGATVRMDETTDLNFKEIIDKSYKSFISLNLRAGRIWVNSASAISDTDLKIYTNHLAVRAHSGIFSAEQNENEAIRAMKGGTEVDVVFYEDLEPKITDTINVGIGQQIVIGDKELKLYEKHQSPNVLDALSDIFKQEDWYKWNVTRDSSEKESIAVEEIKPLAETAEEAKLAAKEPEKDITPPEKPIIIFPKSGTRIKSEPLIIEGTASDDTDKISITTYLDNKPGIYILSKYKKGDLKFKYIASEAYGNLKPGENKFLITAKDEAGNESDSAEVTVIYDKPVQEEAVPIKSQSD